MHVEARGKIADVCGSAVVAHDPVGEHGKIMPRKTPFFSQCAPPVDRIANDQVAVDMYSSAFRRKDSRPGNMIA